MKSFARAFTLIEILIVVVILGILAAIIIPQFYVDQQKAEAQKQKNAQFDKNLEQTEQEGLQAAYRAKAGGVLGKARLYQDMLDDNQGNRYLITEFCADGVKTYPVDKSGKIDREQVITFSYESAKALYFIPVDDIGP